MFFSICILSLLAILNAQLPNINQEERPTNPEAPSKRIIPVHNVTIYYEAMDARSQIFFNNTLSTIYDNFSSYFNFVFVPCQHVQYYFKELYCFSAVDGNCLLNKVHACAINKGLKNAKLTQFLICTMSSNSVFPDYEGCAISLGIEAAELTECASSEIGTRLCTYYRFKKKSGIPNFPSLVFDTSIEKLVGYDDFVSKSLLTDFKTGLCNKLKGQKKPIFPKDCDGRLNFEIFYNSMQVESQKWFNTVLKSLFDKFSSVVYFQFVPCQSVKMTNDELDCGKSIDKNCFSGKVHSCAIRLVADQQTLFKFLLCTMTGVGELPDFQQCANANNVDFASIKSCADGDNGRQLCFHNSLRVYEPRDVPSFVFNGIYINEISKAAFTDLQVVLCQELQGNNLIVSGLCDSQPFKLSIFYDSLDLSFQTWIWTSFMEYYEEFSTFVLFDFIPCRGVTIQNQNTICNNMLDPNCYINKIHSCVISQIKDSPAIIKFMLCASQNMGLALPSLQECIEAIQIDYNVIVQCAESENGVKLCTDYNAKGPKDYPNALAFIVNDKWDEKNNQIIVDDYLQGLCQVMIANKVPRPNICYTLINSVQ